MVGERKVVTITGPKMVDTRTRNQTSSHLVWFCVAFFEGTYLRVGLKRNQRNTFQLGVPYLTQGCMKAPRAFQAGPDSELNLQTSTTARLLGIFHLVSSESVRPVIRPRSCERLLRLLSFSQARRWCGSPRWASAPQRRGSGRLAVWLGSTCSPPRYQGGFP